MYRQTDADTEDTEGFIDYGRGIEGVGITVFIRPSSEGSWKLSFRGANSLDVGSLASELGGGGHRYAAGCDLHGSLDEVKERVRPFVTRLLSN
jgi:phosphoesterase RecJ-like protein